MARYTSLYQAPRSPLIQGRTRWERPLWQAWLGGAVAGGVFALAASLVLRVPLSGAWAPWGLALVVVICAGLGALFARSFGWRMRWLGSALLSSAGVGLALLVLKYYSQLNVR